MRDIAPQRINSRIRELVIVLRGLSFSFGRWMRNKDHTGPAMPGATCAFYCLVFASGLCMTGYILWRQQNWFAAALAAEAAVMLLVPLFIRREFEFVAALEREGQADLKAQMLASNEMMRLAREKDMAMLTDIRAGDARRLEQAYQDYARLQLENERLKTKLLPFSHQGRMRERGRFVRSRPTEQKLTINSVPRLSPPGRTGANSAMIISEGEASRIAPGRRAVVVFAERRAEAPPSPRAGKKRDEWDEAFIITIEGSPPLEIRQNN